jgi:hypothetical protein
MPTVIQIGDEYPLIAGIQTLGEAQEGFHLITCFASKNESNEDVFIVQNIKTHFGARVNYSVIHDVATDYVEIRYNSLTIFSNTGQTVFDGEPLEAIDFCIAFNTMLIS